LETRRSFTLRIIFGGLTQPACEKPDGTHEVDIPDRLPFNFFSRLPSLPGEK